MLYLIPSVFLSIGCRNEKITPEPAQDIVPIDADSDGFLEDEDCNDSDASIYPGAVELCDGIDNNCDDNIDEDVTIEIYTDNDGDGFGDENDAVSACDLLEGYASNGTDCDDSEPNAYPGNQEVCDGIDNDCNDKIDDDDLNLDLNTAIALYADNDGDGFGDLDSIVYGCVEGENQVFNGDDCDDNNESIHPQATEVCDDIDNDCDGLMDLDDDSIDENSGGIFYLDQDGDGFGDESQFLMTCVAPEGYVDSVGDCDDSNESIHPQATEICDDIDNDCDALVDDADNSVDTTTGSTFYTDSDLDGYGDPANSTMFCADPGYGYADNDSDCDDTQSYTFPGSAYQEGNDCLSDFDGDGYAPQEQGGQDCDDSNAAILPQTTDIIGDNIDQNCDGIDGTDIDGDGYASQASGGEDCDDSDASFTLNCPPTLSDVSIVGNPISTEDLQCVATGNDPDGDALSFSYRWQISGNEISTVDILSATNTEVADDIMCCAIASDGNLDSVELCSSSLIIENQLPVVDSISLSSSQLFTNDTLVATASASDADPSQSTTLTYEWHVIDSTGNDSVVQNSAQDSLDGSIFFEKDDIVYVSVVANDGIDASLPLESTHITVQNTEPTEPTISIAPDPAIAGEDDLTCSIDGESTDEDGDTISYTYTWTDPDGAIQQTTAETTSLSDVYIGSGTTEGTWTCSVEGNDGTVGVSSSASIDVEPSGDMCHSIQFTSTNGSMQVSNTGFGVGGGDWTFEFWIRVDGLFGGGSHLFVQNESYSAYALRAFYYPQTGLARCYTYRNTSGSHNLDNGWSDPIDDGEWHHIACSYSSGSMRVYTDGVLSTIDSGSPILNENSSMSIGKASGYSSYQPPSVSLGPIRFSSTARYPNDFTPQKDWSVDSSTIAQYLVSSGFNGSVLTDEAGGNNNGSLRQDIVANGSCD